MTTSRRTLRRRESRRAVVVGIVAATIALLSFVASRTPTSNPLPPTQSVATVDLNAESSAFYCGGLEHVAGVVESDVAIANLAASRRVVEVTTTNERAQVSLRRLAVRPGRVVHISPANIVGGSLEAVSVVATGGGVAVTEAIRGVNGSAVAPCLTRAAPSWWLTGGSTKKGQSLVLSVFNPYSSKVAFSVALQTPAGVAVPLSFQQLTVYPHRLVALSVHAVAPGEAPIAAHVYTSGGNVVVYGIGRSTEGGPSISLLAGTPTPSNAAYFPLANSSSRRTTELLITNPSLQPIAALVHVWAPPGCARHCPAPFTVNVGAQSSTPLTVSPSTRVPLGRGVATEVTASGEGVVAVQRVSERGGVGQSAPLIDAGASQGYLVLVNPLASGFDDVGIVNPTAAAVHFTLGTVTRHGPARIGKAYVIPARSSLQLGPSALRGMVDGVLTISADGRLSAAADVHGALRGSSVLVAAPAR